MTDIKAVLGPQPTDIEYTPILPLKISLILQMDSYKFAHPFAYRRGIKAMTSYGAARISPDEFTISAGMQLLVNKLATEQITMADIDAAEAFSAAHFGSKLFYRQSWEKVVTEHNGFLPLTIRAAREGTKVKGNAPSYTVTAFGPDFYWMESAFETIMQRAIWYPTTIATLDYRIKQVIKAKYIETGADLSMLPFALHDFGARGVSSSETAAIGGAAHTFNFMGSDTVEGIVTANHYYRNAMAAYSVYATEHSVECSFGLGSDEEIEYLRHQLRTAKDLGLQVISIVIDGRDYERCANALCTVLKDEIIASGVKVVFRPDSGDMMVTVPKILAMQEKAFGSVVNKSGRYRKINYVGIIQGDGVDHNTIKELLDKIADLGYAADNVIFGSGGALLQKVNRDTFKFAQKASAILIEDENGNDYWKGIAKDPVTDSGKKSVEGVLTLALNTETGEQETVRLDTGPLDPKYIDLHVLVYQNGKVYNMITLDEIRKNLEA